MAKQIQYDTDELLTKMECCNLFCEKLKMSHWSYYKYYHIYIKFHYMKNLRDRAGRIHRRQPRIPREIALGLAHFLSGQYDPHKDPPRYILQEYLY